MTLSKSLKISLTIISLALLTLLFVLYTRHQDQHPSTDDAYIQAHIIPVAPRITGIVTDVYVKNQQWVKKGAPLFKIDAQPFQIALRKARAQLTQSQQAVHALASNVETAKAVVKEREASLIATEKSTHRIRMLANEKLTSPQNEDQAESDLTVARAALVAAQDQLKAVEAQLGVAGNKNAQIETAMASVSQAELNLSYTTVRAPATGYIAQFKLRPGAVATAWQPQLALIEQDHWWITANYKETDLVHVKPGQPAYVKIDMFPGQTFAATVASISPGSGASFALLPPENASGNWVKVTQRFPVKLTFKHLTPALTTQLKLGASCHVTIDTDAQA